MHAESRQAEQSQGSGSSHTGAPFKQAHAKAKRFAASVLLLDSQLCFALYSTSLAMTKLYRPLLARLGLTYPQYVVMLALWERDGLTVSALGALVSLDSGTLTPLLKRLQALGLVQRRRGADDEREVLITLTPKAVSLQHKAEAVHEHVACATGCSADQRHEMTRLLQRLRASLLASTQI